MCAYMLTNVYASKLVDRARASAGLSVRDLAEAAGVAVSTVTRIQSAAVDPTISMLERVLDAAGFKLLITAVPHGTPTAPMLRDLASYVAPTRYGLRLIWPRWRTFIANLVDNPHQIPETIYVSPGPAGHPILDALVAALADTFAENAGLPQPMWAAAAPPLTNRYRPTTVTNYDGTKIPPAFLRRNIWIDARALWPATSVR